MDVAGAGRACPRRGDRRAADRALRRLGAAGRGGPAHAADRSHASASPGRTVQVLRGFGRSFVAGRHLVVARYGEPSDPPRASVSPIVGTRSLFGDGSDDRGREGSWSYLGDRGQACATTAALRGSTDHRPRRRRVRRLESQQRREKRSTAAAVARAAISSKRTHARGGHLQCAPGPADRRLYRLRPIRRRYGPAST